MAKQQMLTRGAALSAACDELVKKLDTVDFLCEKLQSGTVISNRDRKALNLKLTTAISESAECLSRIASSECPPDLEKRRSALMERYWVVCGEANSPLIIPAAISALSVVRSSVARETVMRTA